jgi:hypothetical protein
LLQGGGGGPWKKELERAQMGQRATAESDAFFFLQL